MQSLLLSLTFLVFAATTHADYYQVVVNQTNEPVEHYCLENGRSTLCQINPGQHSIVRITKNHFEGPIFKNEQTESRELYHQIIQGVPSLQEMATYETDASPMNIVPKIRAMFSDYKRSNTRTPIYIRVHVEGNNLLVQEEIYVNGTFPKQFDLLPQGSQGLTLLRYFQAPTDEQQQMGMINVGVAASEQILNQAR